jgi:hypothetical protein
MAPHLARHICISLLAFTATRAAAQTRPVDRPQPLDSAALACVDRAAAMRTPMARASFPEAAERFKAGLRSDETLYVTVQLRDPAKHVEQVFVRVTNVAGDSIAGTINSPILIVTGYRRGDPVHSARDQLIDWTIAHPDGTEEGNLIGKMIDTLQLKMQQSPRTSVCALLGIRP